MRHELNRRALRRIANILQRRLVNKQRRMAPRRLILEGQLRSWLRSVFGSFFELQLLPELLPIRYRMRKLRNLPDLYVRRNIHVTHYLNPIGVKRYCFDFSSSGIIGRFLRTKIMVLRRDVCMNASTTVLSFDAEFIFYNKCAVIKSRNDWLWIAIAINNKQRQMVCVLRWVVVTNSRAYGKLVQ